GSANRGRMPVRVPRWRPGSVPRGLSGQPSVLPRRPDSIRRRLHGTLCTGRGELWITDDLFAHRPSRLLTGYPQSGGHLSTGKWITSVATDSASPLLASSHS